MGGAPAVCAQVLQRCVRRGRRVCAAAALLANRARVESGRARAGPTIAKAFFQGAHRYTPKVQEIECLCENTRKFQGFLCCLSLQPEQKIHKNRIRTFFWTNYK